MQEEDEIFLIEIEDEGLRGGFRALHDSLRSLHRKVDDLLDKEDSQMADLSQLQNDVAGLGAQAQAAADELTRLDDLVSGLQAGSVTQDQIDALDQQVAATASALSGAVSASQQAQPPAPVPPAGGGAPAPGGTPPPAPPAQPIV